jgi:hypothetical protein
MLAGPSRSSTTCSVRREVPFSTHLQAKKRLVLLALAVITGNHIQYQPRHPLAERSHGETIRPACAPQQHGKILSLVTPTGEILPVQSVHGLFALTRQKKLCNAVVL